MKREESVTDDVILISEREGGRAEGQARSIWTETRRHVLRSLALTWGRVTRPRGLLCKFPPEAFPQLAELAWPELEHAFSGLLLEDLVTTREKGQPSLLDGASPSEGPQTCRQLVIV